MSTAPALRREPTVNICLTSPRFRRNCLLPVLSNIPQGWRPRPLSGTAYKRSPVSPTQPRAARQDRVRAPGTWFCLVPVRRRSRPPGQKCAGLEQQRLVAKLPRAGVPSPAHTPAVRPGPAQLPMPTAPAAARAGALGGGPADAGSRRGPSGRLWGVRPSPSRGRSQFPPPRTHHGGRLLTSGTHHVDRGTHHGRSVRLPPLEHTNKLCAATANHAPSRTMPP